jgi:hypothetical protein
VELRLVDAGDTNARYAVAVFDVAGEWRSEAALSAQGQPEFGPWSGAGAPPAWLEALARSLLRGTSRTQRADGAWPRRLTRWRPTPEAP